MISAVIYEHFLPITVLSSSRVLFEHWTVSLRDYVSKAQSQCLVLTRCLLTKETVPTAGLSVTLCRRQQAH